MIREVRQTIAGFTAFAFIFSQISYAPANTALLNEAGVPSYEKDYNSEAIPEPEQDYALPVLYGEDMLPLSEPDLDTDSNSEPDPDHAEDPSAAVPQVLDFNASQQEDGVHFSGRITDFNPEEHRVILQVYNGEQVEVSANIDGYFTAGPVRLSIGSNAASLEVLDAEGHVLAADKIQFTVSGWDPIPEDPAVTDLQITQGEKGVSFAGNISNYNPDRHRVELLLGEGLGGSWGIEITINADGSFTAGPVSGLTIGGNVALVKVFDRQSGDELVSYHQEFDVYGYDPVPEDPAEEAPEGVRQAAASFLGIGIEEIKDLRYASNPDAIFCMGTGCATFEGYVDVTTNDGKHYAGIVTGGWFMNGEILYWYGPVWDSPYRPADIYLIETELEAEAVAALAKKMGRSIREIQSIEFEEGIVCMAEGCPLWAGKVKVTMKPIDGVSSIYTGSIAKMSRKRGDYKIEIKEDRPLETMAKRKVLLDLAALTGLRLSHLLTTIANLSSEPANDGTVRVRVEFNGEMMNQGRLIDVLGDSHLPNRASYDVSAESGTMLIQSAELRWEEENGARIANLSYEEGRLQAVQWMREIRIGGSWEILIHMIFLHKDTYSYEDGTVKITSGALFVAMENSGEMVQAVKPWIGSSSSYEVITLEKMVDSQYYPVRVERIDSNGVSDVTTFEYLQAMAGCAYGWGDCQFSGFVQLYSVNRELSSATIQSHTAKVILKGEDTVHTIEFHNLKNLLDQMRGLESRTRVRDAVFADLVKTFGFKWNDLNAWAGEGKIRIKYADGVAAVYFDASLQGMRLMGGEVDPLGEFVVPQSIEYQYRVETVEYPGFDPREGQSEDTGEKPAPYPASWNRILIQAATVRYLTDVDVREQDTALFHIRAIDMKYDSEGQLVKVHMMDAAGQLVKEVVFSRVSPCKPYYYCMMVMPWLNADITYPQRTSGVTKRHVVYNLWERDDMPYGAISEVHEYLKADSQEVLAVNTFHYTNTDGAWTLKTIARKDASGNGTAKIVVDIAYPFAVGPHKALVHFPNGVSMKVVFNTFEQLFDQVRNLKPRDPRVVAMEAVLQQDLVAHFGMHRFAVEDLIKEGKITFETDPETLQGILRIDPSVKAKIGDGYLANLLGDGTMPLEIRYQLMEGPQMGMPCSISEDGISDCPPPVYQVESARFEIGDQYFQLTYGMDQGGHRLIEVSVYDGNPELVCITTPCPTGVLRHTVKISHGDKTIATIHYPEGHSRQVILKVHADNTYHIDTVIDINNKGVTTATSTFEYLVAMPGCAVGINFDCSRLRAYVFLYSIMRKSAHGEMTMTLNLNTSPFEAEIVMGDKIHNVQFRTLEELLDLAAEQDQEEPRIREIKALLQQDLADSYSFSARYIASLVEAGKIVIEVDPDTLRATVKILLPLKAGLAEGHLVNLMGDGKMPEEIHYELIAPNPMIGGMDRYRIKNARFNVGDLYFQLTYGNAGGDLQYFEGNPALGEIKIYKGNPDLVCITTPCPTGVLWQTIKINHNTYNVTADLIFHDGGKVYKSLVTLSRKEDQRLHIDRITEMDKAGNVISKNEFEYLVAMPDCLPGMECLASMHLESIKRTDSQGAVLSEIISFSHWKTPYEALILAGDKEHSVTFVSLADLFKQAAELERQEDRVRPAVLADLVTSFGFTLKELEDWLEKGLMKIEWTSDTITVHFDASLRGQMRVGGEVDPLGQFQIPYTIHFTYRVEQLAWREENKPAPGDEGIFAPVPSPLTRVLMVSATVKYQDVSLTQEDGSELYFPVSMILMKYNHSGQLISVSMLDRAGLPVKEVVFSRVEPCPLPYVCMAVMPWLTADITYPQRTSGVVKRHVDYNLWERNDMPYRGISRVDDIGVDGNILHTNKFVYSKTDELGGWSLVAINRANSKGVMTYIKAERPYPFTAGTFYATAQLSNGRMERIQYKTIEDLLDQIEKLEKLPAPKPPIVYPRPHLPSRTIAPPYVPNFQSAIESMMLRLAVQQRIEEEKRKRRV
jgi:hypothetical protein